MRKLMKKATHLLPDSLYLKIRFRQRVGYKLNLKDPKTFNEKLQWLKLHDRKPVYTQMVDKYAVRRIIAQSIGEEYLIPLVGGPWSSFDEIDFDALPDQFVLKCTHDSGGLIICKDKKTLDIDAARRKVSNCLKTNYYWHGREWPYKNVKPQIIAEKYIQDTADDALTDYKFFCFSGIAKVMYISKDCGKDPRTDFFDMSFHHLPIKARDPHADIPPEKPEKFEEMKKIAEILSKDIPHLRVDFYYANNQVYVGELTFCHMSGMTRIVPDAWNYEMGQWIQLLM